MRLYICLMHIKNMGVMLINQRQFFKEFVLKIIDHAYVHNYSLKDFLVHFRNP